MNKLNENKLLGIISPLKDENRLSFHIIVVLFCIIIYIFIFVNKIIRMSINDVLLVFPKHWKYKYTSILLIIL